jgi:hypothetical protein
VGGAQGYYGNFVDLTSQSFITPGVAQIVKINTDLGSVGFSLSGTGSVVIANPATYTMIYSIQLKNTENGIHYADIWLRFNGSDYPDSTTRFHIPARKSSNEYGYAVATVNYVGTSINPNDIVELWWHADSTSVSIEYLPAGISPVHPAVPSVIATFTQVMYTQLGPTGPSGTSGTSGLLSLLGSTNNGVITLDGSKPNATVESNLTFDGNTLLVSGTVSTDKLKVNTGYSNGYIMTSDSNGNANWQNYGTAKEENYYFSISNTADIRPIYSDSNVTFNWDEPSNQLEMVMNIAPSGSGDMRSLAYIVGGSTQNTFIVSTGVIYDLYASGVSAGNRLEVFVTAENDINYPAYHITVYNTGESFQNVVWIKKIYKI